MMKAWHMGTEMTHAICAADPDSHACTPYTASNAAVAGDIRIGILTLYEPLVARRRRRPSSLSSSD